MQPELNKTFNLKKVFDLFLIMLLFGTAIRLVVGVGYYNANDTTWYQQWAESLPDGLFNVYKRAKEIDLDYPPVYLYFLYITGWLFRAIGGEYHQYTQMFLMKMWPILGDVVCGYLLYKLFGKTSKITGLVASALWLFNPAVIFNSSFWGQTDGIMCLLLFVSFFALEKEKPLLASLLFALAGLTKFQCLFFVPVFLLELYTKFGFKKFVKGILAAAGTVIAVFLPFMIGAKNILLFFDVYLFGQGRYPHCTLNAYNLYGLLHLNWIEDALPAVGGISYNLLSNILLILFFIGLVAIYLYFKRPSVYVVSFLFMNSIFIFTTRMHERYQFVILIFLLMAAIIHKNRKFAYLYMAFSFVILINHLVPLFHWNNSGSFFSEYYYGFMTVFSLINIILYVVSAYISIKFLVDNKNKTKGGTL